jgi:hypothetical protein
MQRADMKRAVDELASVFSNGYMLSGTEVSVDGQRNA